MFVSMEGFYLMEGHARPLPNGEAAPGEAKATQRRGDKPSDANEVPAKEDQRAAPAGSSESQWGFRRCRWSNAK